MDKIKKIKIKSKIILIYSIVIAISGILFYLIIPPLLNYGPGTINTQFDKDVSGGLYYYQQILLIILGLIILVSILLYIILKDIDYYRIYKEKLRITKNPEIEQKINKIKKTCLNLPDNILIFFTIIPLVFAFFVLFLQTSYITSSDFKLVLVIFVLSTTTISITNIYIKKILTKILIELENIEMNDAKKVSLKIKLIMQFLPIVLVCIIFTYIIISSIYEKNNADLLYNYYYNQFKADIEYNEINSLEDLEKSLSKINLYSSDHILFLLDYNFNFVYESGELSSFFKKYASELSIINNNKVYDYYGTSGQGIIYPVQIDDNTYYIGAQYLIYKTEILNYIIFLLILLTLISAIILYIFIKELTKNIQNVSDSLKEISSNKIFEPKEIYVTSSDEIGELTQVYNNIQEIVLKHLKEIEKNQDTLIEKERLASLGEMIGGIAHNLKTPIMSISGASEGILDLINEYESSIEDEKVTVDDHKEIAKEMKDWIKKIKIHTEYMSDVITAVKGQAVALSNEQNTTFIIEELLKHVDILMKHELKNALVYLNVKVEVDKKLELNGNINSLVQVINNIISNAIQCYNGEANKNIDLTVTEENDNIIIKIKDYGPGIKEEIKNKLFKAMITTKGKNGTGLGLFMSYSNIRAHFKGDLLLESKLGEGTTFTIILPK